MFNAPEEGLPLGMIQAKAPHVIPPGGARWVVDAWVHNAGLVSRRGAVVSQAGTPTFDGPGAALLTTADPSGTQRYGVVNSDAGLPQLTVFTDAGLTTTRDLSLPYTIGNPNFNWENQYWDVKPRAGGGVYIGMLARNATTSNGLTLWRGGINAPYAVGTITAARNSKTVTGSGTSWNTFCSSGMFLFDAAGQLIGVVKTVDSDTQLTLVDNAILPAAGTAYSINPFRGLHERHSTGLITTKTDSAKVEGANTKFLDAGLNSGTWDLFRQTDLTYLGTITSVATNTELTLSANAALELTDDFYVAIKQAPVPNAGTTGATRGALHAVYANRQWHIKDNILRFSSEVDADSFDTAPVDGDFIEITGLSNPIKNPVEALVPTFNSLLIFTTKETYAVFGASPAQFELRKILDDGALSGPSVQSWRDGVVFAGREGVYFYNGMVAENISENTLGSFYKTLVRQYVSTPGGGLLGALFDDIYFLHIRLPNLSSQEWMVKGASGSLPNPLTFATHLPSNATTVLTNLALVSTLDVPATNVQWGLVNGTSTCYIINVKNLLETSSGIDQVTSAGWKGAVANYVGNPSGEGPSTTGWTGAGATLDSDGSAAQSGVYALKLTWASNTFAQAFYVPTLIASDLTAGTEWAVSAYVRGNAGAIGKTAVLALYESGGAFGDEVIAANSIVLTGSFQRITATGTVARSDRTSHYISLQGTFANTDILFFDAVQLEKGTAVTSYKDGSFTGYVWEGTANQSRTLVTPGPNFYIESRRYDLGDPMLKKQWRRLALNYRATGGTMTMETILGLNNTGNILTSTFPAQVEYTPQQIRFQKRDQLFGFRLYQTDSTVTRVDLGPWSIGYKPLRPSRL